MVAEIEKYPFTNTFKKNYNRLTRNIQKAFSRKLELLLQDMSYPSLRIKRIQGTSNRWEGSVIMKYRFTFQIAGTTLIFRIINWTLAAGVKRIFTMVTVKGLNQLQQEQYLSHNPRLLLFLFRPWPKAEESLYHVRPFHTPPH